MDSARKCLDGDDLSTTHDVAPLSRRSADRAKDFTTKLTKDTKFRVLVDADGAPREAHAQAFAHGVEKRFARGSDLGRRP